MSAAKKLTEALQAADFDDYRRLLHEAQAAELEERARLRTPPKEAA